MKKGRPALPREVRVRFWDGIRAGLGTREAAAAAGVSQSLALEWFRAVGGVKGNAPAAGSGRYLCLAEREEIALGRARGEAVRQIAARLGRAPSTVSRELGRNGGGGLYRALAAQEEADARAARPKPAKLAVNRELRDWVQDKLGRKWSPEQISKVLAAEFGDRPEMRVSHETIYQAVYVQGRGCCGGSWPGACGRGGRCASRGARTGSGAGRSRGW